MLRFPVAALLRSCDADDQRALSSRASRNKHGEIHGNTPSAQSHNTINTMIATVMVLMTVRGWLGLPARRQVRRYGWARKNAGCALVLLTRLDAMLLSFACVSFAVVLLFSKRFLLSLKTPISNASLGAPLIVGVICDRLWHPPIMRIYGACQEINLTPTFLAYKVYYFQSP